MTLFGCDTSNNEFTDASQVGPLINTMANTGFSWLEAKVSQGGGFRDEFWAPTQAACNGIGFPLIGYHFVDNSDPGAQAANFVSCGGGTVAMLDFEYVDDNSDPLCTADDFWNVVNAFNAAGVQIALSYYPDWYWGDIGSPDLTGVPGLISSAYPTLTPDFASTLYLNGGGDRGEGWNAYGNATPVMWQFTDAAIVAGYHLDCNAFQGSLDQLTALLKGAPTS